MRQCGQQARASIEAICCDEFGRQETKKVRGVGEACLTVVAGFADAVRQQVVLDHVSPTEAVILQQGHMGAAASATTPPKYSTTIEIE